MNIERLRKLYLIGQLASPNPHVNGMDCGNVMKFLDTAREEGWGKAIRFVQQHHLDKYGNRTGGNFMATSETIVDLGFGLTLVVLGRLNEASRGRPRLALATAFLGILSAPLLGLAAGGCCWWEGPTVYESHTHFRSFYVDKKTGEQKEDWNPYSSEGPRCEW